MQISFTEYSKIIKIEIFSCGIHLTYFDQLSEVINMYNDNKIKRKNSREPCLGEFNAINLSNNSSVGENCPEVFHGDDVYKQSFF